MSDGQTGAESATPLVSAQTPAGFRDYRPSEVAARHQMLNTIRASYERFGFDPLDTPAVEFLDTLLGPSHAQDDESAKMIFETRRLRGRAVAGSEETESLGLRFDLTVPLARYVAAQSGQLPRPFKRYQVGPVWRGERPQKGRFCEFLQFDLDVIGSYDLYTDAEVMWGVHDTLLALGVERFKLRINSRKILNGLPALAGFEEERLVDVIRVLDKLDKVGLKNVLRELGEGEKGLGLSAEAVAKVKAFMELKGDAGELLTEVEALCSGEGVMAEGAQDLRQICAYLEAAGVSPERWELDLSIARGLGYYTGAVFETTLLDLPKIGSVCSGGRYDGLVSRFSSDSLPAVGASIGVDRLFVALQELKQVTVTPTCVQVLVTQMEKGRQADYVSLVARLRRGGFNVSLYQGENTSFKAQMSLATKREIPVVIICGGREFRDGQVAIKDMAARAQHVVPVEEMCDTVARIIHGSSSAEG